MATRSKTEPTPNVELLAARVIATGAKILQRSSVAAVALLIFVGSAHAQSHLFWAINQFTTIQQLDGDTGLVVNHFPVPFLNGNPLGALSIAVINNEGYYTLYLDANVYKVNMTTHLYDGIAFNTGDSTWMNGITVDVNQHLWFAHGGSSNLQEFDTAGTLLDTESFPDPAAGFRDGSVVFNGFLVANRGDQVGPYDKYALHPGGTLTYVSKPFINQGSGSNGIAFNGLYFYVSNEQTHIVSKFDTSGTFVSSAPLAPSSRYENWTFASQDIVPNGDIEICKASDPNHPVTGLFTFTAINGGFNSGPISVPVGQCSGSIQVPSGAVTVTETPVLGVAVSNVTAYAYDELGFYHDELSSWTQPDLHAIVNVMAGDQDEETLTTFTNYAAPPGLLKLCKVAGDPFTLGQIFQFTVTSGSQRNVYYITAGPPAQGGNCVLAGNFPVNTQVMIQETPQFFFRPSQITVNEGQLMACTPPSIYCTVATTIPGITEVTFTNVLHFGIGVH